MRKTLIAIALALALVTVPVGSAFAANPVVVSVTATPAYVSLSLDVNTWEINGIAVPGSKIKPSTTYYANPLGDTTVPATPIVAGACRFQFTNDGNVAINITCNFVDFAGIVMTNGAGGYTVSGATTFGASGYAVGVDLPGVIFKKPTTGSGVFISGLDATNVKKWGVALKTQSGVFTSATPMTSTITCTAVQV